MQKNIPVVMIGYVINLYGQDGVWIFQPCDDSSIFVLDAIGNHSFFVQDMINDLGHTNLRDIFGYGQTMPLTFFDGTSEKEVKGEMKYLFCRLTINPTDVSIEAQECAYMIYQKGLRKGLSCISFSNYVTELEPLDPEIRKRYLKSFKAGSLPDWAK